MNPERIPVAAPQIIWRQVDEGGVLVSPQKGDVRVLNEVGTAIWQLMDGQHTLQDIEDYLLQNYDVSPERLRADLHKFLNDLAEKQLLVWHS